MTIRDQIIQELDQVPESQLEQVLELVRSWEAQHALDMEHDKFWQAYQTSKKSAKRFTVVLQIPRFLTLSEVLELHHDQVSTFGGTFRVREGLLESALAQLQATLVVSFYIHRCTTKQLPISIT